MTHSVHNFPGKTLTGHHRQADEVVLFFLLFLFAVFFLFFFPECFEKRRLSQNFQYLADGVNPSHLPLRSRVVEREVTPKHLCLCFSSIQIPCSTTSGEPPAPSPSITGTASATSESGPLQNSPPLPPSKRLSQSTDAPSQPGAHSRTLSKKSGTASRSQSDPADHHSTEVGTSPGTISSSLPITVSVPSETSTSQSLWTSDHSPYSQRSSSAQP